MNRGPPKCVPDTLRSFMTWYTTRIPGYVESRLLVLQQLVQRERGADVCLVHCACAACGLLVLQQLVEREGDALHPLHLAPLHRPSARVPRRCFRARQLTLTLAHLPGITLGGFRDEQQ